MVSVNKSLIKLIWLIPFFINRILNYVLSEIRARYIDVRELQFLTNKKKGRTGSGEVTILVRRHEMMKYSNIAFEDYLITMLSGDIKQPA